MTADQLALGIRILAAALWFAVLWDTFRAPLPDPEAQTRQLLSAVLIAGFTIALVIGGLLNVGLVSLDVTKFAYTAMGGAVLIGALSILLDRKR